MNKAQVLQLVALLFIIIAGYQLYEIITNDQTNAKILGAVGPIIMACALVLISKSDAFIKK